MTKQKVSPVRHRRKSKTGNKYLYNRIVALYLHSLRARLSLLYLVFADKDVKDARNFYKQSDLLRAASVFILIAGSFVVLQLAYPRDRTMPFSRLESSGFIGFKSKSEITDKIRGLDSKVVTVKTHKQSVTTNYSSLGLQLSPEATFHELSNYPKSQRLVPFSIFFVGNDEHMVSRQVRQAKLSDFVKNIIRERNKSPRDASVTLIGQKLTVAPSEDGYEYDEIYLKEQIMKAELLSSSSLNLSPKILPANISSQLASGKAGHMQKRIDTPLVIWADERTMTADSQMLASWIKISAKPSEHNIDIIFDKSRVEVSLRPFAASVEISAKPDVVTLLNGSQAGSTPGTTGRTLPMKELVEQVASSTDSSSRSIQAALKFTPPTTAYERRYSRDNHGVQTLIDYWAQNHRGQHGVVMRTLNGNIEASAGADAQFSGAGINDVYLAHLIYGRISAGTLNGYSATSTGNSVDGCLSQMIITSDVGCRNALGNILGWNNSDDMLRSQGFNYTSVSPGGVTTASDSADWIYKMIGGTLTSYGQMNTLVELLSNQIYRSGIPSGSEGMLVANKAGYGYGNIYDVGLIYHPRGAYVLSVISSGASFSDIADLSSEINKVLYE